MIQSHLIPYNTTDYYRFSIENDTDIENVTIILSSINGDADLYSSRVERKPSYTNCDRSK